MATQFDTTCAHSYSRAAVLPFYYRSVKSPFFLFSKETPFRRKQLRRNYNSTISISRIKAINDGGDSFMAENSAEATGGQVKEESPEDLERRSREFQKLLEVSAEERDRVQRMQVIDRAAAAIAAARALLNENLSSSSSEEVYDELRVENVDGQEMEDQREAQPGTQSGNFSLPQSGIGTPGPSFWAWAPPLRDDDSLGEIEINPAAQASPSTEQSSPVLEQDRGLDFLSIPFETSMLQNKNSLQLPPLQSLVEVEKVDVTETSRLEEKNELGVQFSAHAAEAADALNKVNEASPEGVNPDGSRWWKETGIERRPDGVICKWTLTRGVSADKAVEWENKYWEAADEFGYKELGSEKSGRDAAGNVWREYWRESMMQNEGLVHFEKTADKWGKNIQGDEWQEKWWEHYDASGRADKWAHKWCSIDRDTPVEVGHAHVWHERWGEKYDGQGGSIKYTDKWAERFEGDGWSKWGDKWDEHFDANGHGVKQGETWWEGKYSDRWNRTWGEGHDGSGWVHKYGKSSSGEHWDTHVQQETWYERFPHYGFYHCFENSVQLREVKSPSEWQ
ncbi:hypothetical protein CDL12_29959 [Handroanthus impetiginosus]|uniref:Uncharacterized protein n=1 Tax=Handroanthus impetiginosus TaxID=429701 RepID=A0A2G9FWY1_9LAMI|nr:hypothetical protein CDL12_29959 [Handroanthus impetiginosus]